MIHSENHRCYDIADKLVAWIFKCICRRYETNPEKAMDIALECAYDGRWLNEDLLFWIAEGNSVPARDMGLL